MSLLINGSLVSDICLFFFQRLDAVNVTQAQDIAIHHHGCCADNGSLRKWKVSD